MVRMGQGHAGVLLLHSSRVSTQCLPVHGDALLKHATGVTCLPGVCWHEAGVVREGAHA